MRKADIDLVSRLNRLEQLVFGLALGLGINLKSNSADDECYINTRFEALEENILCLTESLASIEKSLK